MYNRYKLKNGISVVTCKINHLRSAAIGVWVRCGSINETEEFSGISHFIEHMLFKGTYKRTAKDIASEMDNIGGQLNAFTSKECTCYYAKVIDEHLDQGLDILSDMFINSRFDEEEIKKELSVVHEEIDMYEDSPEDLCYDLLAKVSFESQALGRPILGTHQSIDSITRDKIMNYMDNNYTADNIVISIAGSFDEDTIVDKLNEYFGCDKLGSNSSNQLKTAPEFTGGYNFRDKDIEQFHIGITFKGIHNRSELIYPLYIFNNIFGGSMSSRLFQKIREEHGLAYSVYAHPTMYCDSGMFTIYLSLNPSQLTSALTLIVEEINKVKNYDLTEEEINRSKQQLKGNYILGLESSQSNMSLLGKSEVLGRDIHTIDDIVDKINDVNDNDIMTTIHKIFNADNLALSMVGKLDEAKVKECFDLLVDGLKDNKIEEIA